METTPLTGKSVGSSTWDDPKKKRNLIIIIVIIVLLIVIAITVTLVVVLQKKAQQDSLMTRLGNIANNLNAMSSPLANFWSKYGPDPINQNNPDISAGGFYGTIMQNGTPGQPDTKTLIQISDNLYGISSLVNFVDNSYTTIAQDLFDFMDSFLYEEGLEPGSFYYMVSRNGSLLLDNSTQFYAESVALRALAQFYFATGQEYLDGFFENLFNEMDLLYHDPVYGGYLEYYNDSGQAFVNGPFKTLAGHITFLDALYHIFAYDSNPNPNELPRLNEVINLFLTNFIQVENYLHPIFNPDWSLYGPPLELFGYELYAIEVLRSAANVLNYANVTQAVNSLVQGFGPMASTNGYDNAAGGYYYSEQSGSITDNRKVYWVQTASMWGNWNLYELTQDPTYLDRIEGTISFIQANLVDQTYGEWFYSVEKNPLNPYPDGTNKGTQTKGAQWTISATVVLPNRINTYIAENF
jgi:mannobiose 2-epimerase